MKGLRKYLTPFAPDQSGAVSVLYELGGIVVICDAGGCAGNVCGFDEPRWFTRKSAVFSAGLRDMDAILGRDDRLVAKLQDTANKLNAEFAAIIGTPVPAVIATDYRALQRMAERKVDLPVLTVDTTGMGLYDEGAEKAFLTLMQRFAVEKLPVEPGRVGIIGMTPLDFGDPDAGEKMKEKLAQQGYDARCYGMGDGLESIREASAAEKNIVVSAAGLKAAKYLKEQFGTPYEVCDPLAEDGLPEAEWTGKRVLVVHQQVRANTIRRRLMEEGCARVDVATWFLKKPELAMAGDIRLTEEDQLEELVRQGEYDILIGDRVLWDMVPDAAATKLDLPHFAVSGRLG